MTLQYFFFVIKNKQYNLSCRADLHIFVGQVQRSPSGLRKRLHPTCPAPVRVPRPSRFSKSGNHTRWTITRTFQLRCEHLTFSKHLYMKMYLSQHLEAPLHLAVRLSHIPVTHSLLVAGCNINITDKVRSSPLSKTTRCVRMTVTLDNVC